MVQVLFDTQSAVDELKRGGFTDEQAKANVRFVRDALEGGVATKADIEGQSATLRGEMDKQTTALCSEMDRQTTALRSEMDRQTTALRGEMADIRSDLDKQGVAIRGELKTEIQAVRGEIAVLRAEMKTFRFQILASLAGATGLLGVLIRFFS